MSIPRIQTLQNNAAALRGAQVRLAVSIRSRGRARCETCGESNARHATDKRRQNNRLKKKQCLRVVVSIAVAPLSGSDSPLFSASM